MRPTVTVPVVTSAAASAVFRLWAVRHNVFARPGHHATLSPAWRSREAGYIYFATPIAGEGFIKVGFSISPVRRSRSFRASPLVPYVGRVFLKGFSIFEEQHLHNNIASFAARGEYYPSDGPVGELMRALIAVATKITGLTVPAARGPSRPHAPHTCSVCRQVGHNRATCARKAA